MKNSFLLFGLFMGLWGCAPITPLDNPFVDETRPSPNLGNLRIDILDVGQGDATLVRGPNGKTLLIDAGRPGSGTEVILPHLQERGLERLDWILATHYDADHIGGLAEVVRGSDQILGTDDDFVPTESWIDRGDGTDKSSAVHEEYVSLLPPNRLEASPGMILNLGDGAEAEVIVVNGRYSDGRSIHLNPDEENEASIGLLIRYGDFTYFTAGDLPGGGAPGGFETKDLETPAGEIVGDIDILHAGHHGSASSSNKGFLETSLPETVVISVGLENDYGHPHPHVLERIQQIGAALYRTDESGTIQIVSDGKEYRLTPSDFPQ